MAPDAHQYSNSPGWVASVTLPEPCLQDNTADTDRLVRSLKKEFDLETIDADLALCRKLPLLMRENHYRVRCIVCRDRGRGVLIHVGPDDTGIVLAGLAIDLGTTRVVMRIVDLDNGHTLAETAFDNPQIIIGPDILARIHHTDRPDGLAELNALIVDGINRHLAELCGSRGLRTDQIHLIAVAGNTAMTHLFAGLPVHWMIREPYIPAVNRFGLIPAADLGMTAASFAQVLIFPNVGSYFGGDLIAGILYAGLHTRSETAILVDVGTNAEVVIGNQDWLMACAGAAGPALEGGMSRMGTMAAPGVIDRVRIDPDSGKFELHTIGELPPVGICGSGVIDLAAQLFLAGMIDIRGKFHPPGCGSRLSIRSGMAYLTIVSGDQSGSGRDLCISQADMDSLVRSKAAMYTILETITGTMGMALSDLATFYVAGTFGSLIDPESAITIGMIPDLPLERYKSLGNSSLGGAALALMCRNLPKEIETVRDRITYLELNVNQDFMNRFSAAKFLPHTDNTRFPSVKPDRP
jgi:uncharacterized 2Fe-2S/4Fe-4S cluster protein (DUF4445 family)